MGTKSTRSILAALLVVQAISGCADFHPAPAQEPAESSLSVSDVDRSSQSKTTVSATLVAVKPGRPPLERLFFDVQLRNKSRHSCWILFPSRLPQPTGGIDKLEQLSVGGGTRTITIGRFLGTGGRYALRLGPGATVILRKLEVAWWRTAGASEIVVAIQSARDVSLGGEAMETWFDRDPTISESIDVDMETVRYTASHRAPDDKEVVVSIMDAAMTSIKLMPP